MKKNNIYVLLGIILVSSLLIANVYARFENGSVYSVDDSPLYSTRLKQGIEALDPPKIDHYATNSEAADEIEQISLQVTGSGCVGSLCCGSFCIGSGCAGSLCIGSFCLTTYCIGSVCDSASRCASECQTGCFSECNPTECATGSCPSNCYTGCYVSECASDCPVCGK